MNKTSPPSLGPPRAHQCPVAQRRRGRWDTGSRFCPPAHAHVNKKTKPLWTVVWWRTAPSSSTAGARSQPAATENRRERGGGFRCVRAWSARGFGRAIWCGRRGRAIRFSSRSPGRGAPALGGEGIRGAIRWDPGRPEGEGEGRKERKGTWPLPARRVSCSPSSVAVALQPGARLGDGRGTTRTHSGEAYCTAVPNVHL